MFSNDNFLYYCLFFILKFLFSASRWWKQSRSYVFIFLSWKRLMNSAKTSAVGILLVWRRKWTVRPCWVGSLEAPTLLCSPRYLCLEPAFLHSLQPVGLVLMTVLFKGWLGFLNLAWLRNELRPEKLSFLGFRQGRSQYAICILGPASPGHVYGE